MKVLLVNKCDITGGAARAAYRLSQALLNQGVNCQMLVQSKSGDDYHVLAPTTKLKKAFGRLRSILDGSLVYLYRYRTGTLFSANYIPFSDIVDRINILNPDIVHLHWVAGGMMRIEDIAKIRAPIIWSLHDMWAFTGGCHYDEECARYMKSCGCCKVLGSENGSDLSLKIFRRKEKTFSSIPSLTLVGLSRWLAEEAKKSSLFGGMEVVNLPNPIDTMVYSPMDKSVARDLYNLPQNKKLVLFGAIGATSDPRKGFESLSNALENIDVDDTELVVFGSGEPQTSQGFKQKAHYLGYMHDDVSLKVLYSAADVMVVPSRQEAFGQTASESMACGTPVVAFACTGLLDIVDHKENGYLAKPYDTADLATGIEWVLNAPNYDELSANAHNKVLNEFDSKLVAKKYMNLYEGVIKKC